jgi:hypothetical protein
MESSAVYLRVLGSWQIIVVCLFLMFLLPLVFYVASTKSRKKSFTRAPKKAPAKEKPRPVAAPAAVDEPEEGPDARRRDRAEPPE